jgi:hypothetical protein
LCWIVIGSAAVKEAVSDYLVDDFALEVGSQCTADWIEED